MMRNAMIQLIYWLSPKRRQEWSRAMQAEILSIDRKIDALVFAAGCLLACARFQMENISMPKSIQRQFKSDPFFSWALWSGIVAGLIGLAYLASAGAPSGMILINALTLVVAILLAIMLRLTVQIEQEMLSFIAISSAALLIATALFGLGIEGASRWLALGPYMIQPSLILLPLIAVCYARHSNTWTALAVVASATAMALQPDRAMAGMLFMAMMVVSFARPSNGRFAVSLSCAVMFVITMMLPDNLTAVPYVDHILWTAFEISSVMGLLMWFGCALLLAPVLFASGSRPGIPHIVFAVSWLAVIAAAAMGAYPTPIVGYGASSILGYFLCLTFVESRVEIARSDDTHEIMQKDRQDGARTKLVPAFV